MTARQPPDGPAPLAEPEALRRAALARAQLLARQGQWAEATPLYRSVIAELTDDVEALRGMGLAALHGDRPAEAVSWLTRAGYSAPYSVPILTELGLAQKRAGLIHDAIATYRRALALGQRRAGEEPLRSVLAALAQPENPAPVLALARSQRAQRPAVAITCLEHALRLQPSGAVARELGQLLWEQGRAPRAFELVLRAFVGDRSDVASFRLLGEWLSAPRALELQSKAWQRLIAECPADPPSLRNLGVALRRQGYPLQAAELQCAAVQLEPRHPASWVNLGAALSSQGAVPEAIEAYRRALELAPDHWDAASNLLLSLHLDPAQTPEAIFAEHVRIGEQLAQQVPLCAQRAPQPLGERRLRVGYVSPDLRSHPVAHFLEPVLREHDRARLEVFCYSDVEHPDARTTQLAALSEHFVPCAGWSDEQLAERISQDGIDILVDLAGHTAQNRLPLFASKPAPLQLSWLGYFDTTGLTRIDARIADPVSLPHSAAAYFVERIVHLPRSANCFLPPAGPEPSPPPCLSRGRITFGCYNNPAKIGRTVVGAFARVLHAVPGSELVLKYLAFNEPQLRERYQIWFTAAGIAPERVRFEGPSALSRFHDSFSDIDIALDPFPYSGETTALHTLWMGVPLVALEGPTLVQRLASRVLRIAGLDAWVASDVDEYVQIAAELARDQIRLELLRGELRRWLSASPLLDHTGVTRELEAAYQRLWQQACERSARAAST